MSDEAKGQKDRRGSPRADIALLVEYTKLNAFFSDYTKNISHGGTFLRTDDPLPVGTVFQLRLVLPAGSLPRGADEAISGPGHIALGGQVAWIKRRGEPSPPGIAEDHEPGMGIRFIYDSPEQQAAITQTVEQLMIQSLGPHLYAKLIARAK